MTDQEWFEKYGILYNRTIKHGTCPFCGSTNVGVNDSPYEADEDCRFHMVCEDCDKTYQAVYTFSHTVTTKHKDI